MVVAAHSLAEAYAVLTTLPVSPRLGSGLAWRLLQENVAKHGRIVTLTVREYISVLGDLAARALTGGVVYDALIARAARKAGVDRLVTLNPADFRRAWPDGEERIISP